MPFRTIGVNGQQYGHVLGLKNDGVFKKTHMSSRQEENDPPVSVTVTCGDAKKLLRCIKFHGKSVGQLIHPVTIIGGGVGFHVSSPLNGRVRFPLEYMMHQIRLASEAMNNTKILSVYMHCPCGGCAKYGISVPQQVELNFLGLGMLNEQLGRENFQITPYAHIYYGQDSEFDSKLDETFELDLPAWLESRERYAAELNLLPTRLTEFPAIA